MKETNENTSTRQPWYSADHSEKPGLSIKLERAAKALTGSGGVAGLIPCIIRIADGLTSVALGIITGMLLVFSFTSGTDLGPRIALILMASGSAVAALFFFFRQLGSVTKRLSTDQSSTPNFKLGLQVAKGETTPLETRKTLPAPEMVLHQFVGQVRAYAQERSYQKTKTLTQPEKKYPGSPEPVDLLKRRWNEVLDSLNEFEIYLAGDQKAMIEKLIARHPSTLMDVSQIFREVAESFDTSWRRKGINIESAIVTPLKAVTSEPMLRRILVGPWRSCAYFARRGKGVVFSAQSVDGKVCARWECEGLSIPEDYLKLALDAKRSVNERIEAGIEILGGAELQHGSAVFSNAVVANNLYALVSLITWIDLAQACDADFEFKNTNDGFVITLRLS